MNARNEKKKNLNKYQKAKKNALGVRTPTQEARRTISSYRVLKENDKEHLEEIGFM